MWSLSGAYSSAVLNLGLPVGLRHPSGVKFDAGRRSLLSDPYLGWSRPSPLKCLGPRPSRFQGSCGVWPPVAGLLGAGPLAPGRWKLGLEKEGFEKDGFEKDDLGPSKDFLGPKVLVAPPIRSGRTGRSVRNPRSPPVGRSGRLGRPVWNPRSPPVGRSGRLGRPVWNPRSSPEGLEGPSVLGPRAEGRAEVLRVPSPEPSVLGPWNSVRGLRAAGRFAAGLGSDSLCASLGRGLRGFTLQRYQLVVSQEFSPNGPLPKGNWSAQKQTGRRQEVPKKSAL